MSKETKDLVLRGGVEKVVNYSSANHSSRNGKSDDFYIKSDFMDDEPEIIYVNDELQRQERQQQNLKNLLRNISDTLSNMPNHIQNSPDLGVNNIPSYLIPEYTGEYTNLPTLTYSNLKPKIVYYMKQPTYNIQKKPQERMDYINKPNQQKNYVVFNNTPVPPAELTTSSKKQNNIDSKIQNNQNFDYMLYPENKEQRQIKNTTKNYQLLDNTKKTYKIQIYIKKIEYL